MIEPLCTHYPIYPISIDRYPFTNPPTVGTGSFTLILTNGGSAAVTFPTVKWPLATAPTLTAAGADILVFTYHDSAWYAVASGIGMA